MTSYETQKIPKMLKETDNVTKVTKKMRQIFKHQKIPIGKIISDQGLMVPSAN